MIRGVSIVFFVKLWTDPYSFKAVKFSIYIEEQDFDNPLQIELFLQYSFRVISKLHYSCISYIDSFNPNSIGGGGGGFFSFFLKIFEIL